MKRIAGLLILAVTALSACKNKTEFTIDGKASNTGNLNKVMLYQADNLIDSAFLNEKGEFKFKRSAPDPDFYALEIGEKKFLLIAQNGDAIDFKTNLTDTANTYEIKGSEASEKVKEFNQMSNKYGKVYTKLNQDYENAVNADSNSRDSVYAALMPQFMANMDAFSNEALKFAQDNKGNLAGFYAIGTINNPEKYELQMIQYSDDIKSKFPNNKAVQAFVTKMENIKPIAIGKVAPDFELPTPDGKLVSLADYKGKYVLLDFWASWCAPCRKENPNVVKQYNTFKGKGFDVFSVSLDDDKSAWLKAIKEDGLTWTHVSQLNKDPWSGKVTESYKIDAIPSSFLLGPDGKILAKNLRGLELEEFLKKTFK